MDVLILLVIGGIAVLGFVAFGLGGVVAAPAASPGHYAPPPASAPGMLVESDVRGGIHGVFP